MSHALEPVARARRDEDSLALGKFGHYNILAVKELHAAGKDEPARLVIVRVNRSLSVAIREGPRVRLDSSLGYLPPIEGELIYRRSQLQQAELAGSP